MEEEELAAEGKAEAAPGENAGEAEGGAKGEEEGAKGEEAGSRVEEGSTIKVEDGSAQKKKKGKKEEEKKKNVVVEEESPNTFQLEPTYAFNSNRARKVVEDVIEETFSGKVYCRETIELMNVATDEILHRIYDLNFTRHKIVVVVEVIEKVWQEAVSVVHVLWDVERDGRATYAHECASFVAVGSVFCLNYE